MKQLALFAVLGLIGAVLGAAFLPSLGAVLFPDSGSEHGAWFASRAAGLSSYVLLWLAAVIGVMMSSAWLDGMVNRGRLLAMHQSATYAGLLLGVGHALVLIPDRWTQFGLTDLFIPFASYYEPTQTGLGTMALYLFALVTFSFWMRGAIGTTLWRTIHFTSFVALAGAFWHGISLGTDSTEPWGLTIYIVTSAVLVMAVVMRLTYLKPKPVRQPRPAAAAKGAAAAKTPATAPATAKAAAAVETPATAPALEAAPPEPAAAQPAPAAASPVPAAAPAAAPATATSLLRAARPAHHDTKEALATVMAEMRAKVLAEVLDEMRAEVLAEVLAAVRGEAPAEPVAADGAAPPDAPAAPPDRSENPPSNAPAAGARRRRRRDPEWSPRRRRLARSSHP